MAFWLVGDILHQLNLIQTQCSVVARAMQLNLVTPLNSIIFGDIGTRWKRSTDYPLVLTHLWHYLAVMFGYRLGIDWITIGVRLNRQKSITEFRPNIDQNLTRSKARGDGKGGGMSFLLNVILSLGEESQMEQVGNRCFVRLNMTSPFFTWLIWRIPRNVVFLWPRNINRNLRKTWRNDC